MLHQPSRVSLTTCVIGGAGFIGRAVVAELLAQGRQVVVVGRGNSPIDFPSEVRYVDNPGEAGMDVLRTVLLAADEVIDLAYATSPGTSFQDPINDILVNVPETVRLFELASTMTHLRKFVWISSGGTVYGRTAAAAVEETHPTYPLSPYGITKLALEKYAHMYFDTCGLPIVCIRPSNAYGEGQRPYQGQGFVGTAIASILAGKTLSIFGEYGTVRDYLHIADMAAGIVALLELGEPGEVYNLSSGEGHTNRQILELLMPIAIKAGKPIKIQVMPSRPFDVPFNVLNYRKIHAATGWAPKLSMEEGLARTWLWFTVNAIEETGQKAI